MTAPMQGQSLGNFVAQIRRSQDAILARLDEFLQFCGFVVAESIITGSIYSKGTPIVTGNARNGWITSVGGKSSAPGSDAFAAATMAIAGAKIGDQILFTNGVVYIRRLEFGHSKQAPDGFVRITAANWQAIVDDVAARFATDTRRSA